MCRCADGLHYAPCEPTLKASGAQGPDRHPGVTHMVLGSDLRRRTAGRPTGPSAGRGTAIAAALVLLLAPALAACGGDDDDGGQATTSPTAVTSTPGGSANESSAAGGPADPAAAEQEIRQNWEKFFDPDTSMAERQAVLEHGDRMGPVLGMFGNDARGRQAQARVTQVEFTSPTEATVTYDLIVSGQTALPNASGKAVQEDGTWKVSVTTLCALVSLSGNGSPTAMPGC